MAPSEGEAAPDLRARLPRIDPATAALGNALLVAMNGATSAVGDLSARLEPAPVGEIVLRFASGLAARPLTIEGAPSPWLAAEEAPELPEALVELSRLEPMLAGVERALGIALEPERLERWGSNEGALALHVAARDESGQERDGLRLYVSAGLTFAPPPRPLAFQWLAGAAARARVSVRLVFEGPSAPVGELGLLAHGDLVLVGPSSAGFRARLVASAKVSAYGRWRPADRNFICEGFMDETNERDAPPSQGGGLPTELSVRLSLELGAIETTLGELAALAPGAVLKVDVTGDAPRVDVMAGGAHLATGRLVALGESYGVLVDEIRENLRPDAAAAVA